MFEWFIQYWSEVAFGLLVPFIIYIYKQLRAYKRGLLELLRHLIIQYYNMYKERGYVPIYVMESVTTIYVAYHALGGNGTGTKLYEELTELPSKKPEPLEDEEHEHTCEKECGNTCLKMCREHQPDQIL